MEEKPIETQSDPGGVTITIGAESVHLSRAQSMRFAALLFGHANASQRLAGGTSDPDFDRACRELSRLLATKP